MENRVPLLATTASAAPFIGLFGTVWGIMNSFRSIGAKGAANLATVAPGIAEALVATAIGLVAAIPAVMAYNYFVAPDPGGLGRHGDVRQRLPQHRPPEVLLMAMSSGQQRAAARWRRSTSRRWSTSCWCC